MEPDDFFSSSTDILQHPITEKERNHHSRNRIGYHVYVSAYFNYFTALSYEEKKEILVKYRVWNRDNEFLDDSNEEDDSVFTAIQPRASDVIKVAARKWAASDDSLKEAWKERASELNERPRNDGKFESVPTVIVDTSMYKNVMHSLTLDWRNFANSMKHSMITNRQKMVETSEKAYKFGNESVKLHSQCYRSLYMNYLLKISIFGQPPFYPPLLPHEIVRRTKKEVIIHFYSHRRISELFCFGGLNATEICNHGLKYYCCAKANLKDGKKNIIGYVMDEKGDELHIRIDGRDEMVIVKRPKYNADFGEFEYTNGIEKYIVTQLWPIRMKVHQSGRVAYIINVNSST